METNYDERKLKKHSKKKENILESHRSPVLVPIRDEILNLHLLKLPGPENEVPGCDFVTESFTDLSDAEGDLGRLWNFMNGKQKI